MRTIRTRLTATAATVMFLLAAGCGGGGSASPTTADGGGAAPGAAPKVKLVKTGQLTVCTHLPYPPFQLEQDGKIVGFDIDMMTLVSTKLGVKQEVVDTPFETIKTGADLNAGKCDVAAAGMTIKEERKANLHFSDPYFNATQALLVKKGSNIKSLQDIKKNNAKLGSQSATTGEDYVKAQGMNPVSFESSDAELNGLRTGQVQAIVQDLPVVADWLKDQINKDYEIATEFDTKEQYGFGLKKGGDPKLEKVVNEVIRESKANGQYKELYKKWLGKDWDGK